MRLITHPHLVLHTHQRDGRMVLLVVYGLRTLITRHMSRQMVVHGCFSLLAITPTTQVTFSTMHARTTYILFVTQLMQLIFIKASMSLCLDHSSAIGHRKETSMNERRDTKLTKQTLFLYTAGHIKRH
jgi:hypothetical protein